MEGRGDTPIPGIHRRLVSPRLRRDESRDACPVPLLEWAKDRIGSVPGRGARLGLRSTPRLELVPELEVEGELDDGLEDDGIDHAVEAIGARGL